MSREDAAFYTDTHDSWVIYAAGDVKVYRAGEMRINYTNDDGSVSVLRYTSDLDDKGLDTDEKLRAAEESGLIEWIHNPWFEVVESDDEYGEVDLDYTSSIHLANKLAKGEV